MKKEILFFIAIFLIVLFIVTSCSEKEPESVPNMINVNEIEDLASAKIMAESKVITKNELPADLAYIADIRVPNNMKLTMINEIYTKSDMTKEEFNVLHDHDFLFSDDNNRTISVKVSKVGSTLRDYFFQSENKVSTINDINVVISQFRNRYIETFTVDNYSFDVETTGLTLIESIDIVQSLITGIE
jgi:hypothetical protein